MSDLIVTVDGPGGTGKSSVSRELARRAGLPHLDTGAYYRAATLAALEEGADLDDETAVSSIVASVDFTQDDGLMYLDGRDVSAEIRRDDVTKGVSAVSAHPRVRALLVELQRAWIRTHDGRGVVEGRDIGSVVFPDATVKVYLDASPEVRARRRAGQSGEDIDEVLEDLNRRDRLDSTRAASPMTVPDGAIIVDTSLLDFETVVERLLGLLPPES
ncbi:MAG TPA: (d)CMP kinase [Acidimicrobiia bacterium]|nr:(d)CMP kinase [Acidimicrobiia bacterium]